MEKELKVSIMGELLPVIFMIKMTKVVMSTKKLPRAILSFKITRLPLPVRRKEGRTGLAKLLGCF